MEIKLRKWHSYGYLDDIVLRVKDYPSIGWGYTTTEPILVKKYGFKKILYDFEYFLPIKDIAHTRGFYSYVGSKYKGYECYVHSYNACDDKLFCLGIHPDLALAMGYNWNQIGHEMLTIKVPLSDLSEIYRCREKLDDFIFDVDPIKPIYKDGKWLIEPDENGVYVI